MEIKFITELKVYRQQRMDAIQGKKDLLERLQLDYQLKLEQSKALEDEYKTCFDDKVFEALVTQNVQTEELKREVNKTKAQVGLMDIGHLPLKNSEIKKQIDDFINSFKLEKLRENILIKREEYINSIKVHREAMDQIESARIEVEELEPIIVQGNKETIKTAFYKASY